MLDQKSSLCQIFFRRFFVDKNSFLSFSKLNTVIKNDVILAWNDIEVIQEENAVFWQTDSRTKIKK